ncbi:hypothetical protein BJ912DRAFT_1056120 [Pholiota molesta]|nr:hypothetical protein BJ912DRAFT_1056120 [Pholiota molesta]
MDQEKKLSQRTLDLMNPTKYEQLECGGIEQLNGQGGEDETGTAGLNEGSNRHCLVPNLETFEYEGEIDFTSHALVEFLVARWRGRSNPSCCTSVLDLESPPRQLETSLELLPPNVDVPSARLRSATFNIREHIQFGDADAEVIQELRLEGMHLEFPGYSH